MNKHIFTQLVDILGRDSVLYTPEDLAVYGYDGTFVEGDPGVIVLPQTTSQVSQIMRLASAERLPVVPRGMGSGLAAGSIPAPATTMATSSFLFSAKACILFFAPDGKLRSVSLLIVERNAAAVKTQVVKSRRRSGKMLKYETFPCYAGEVKPWQRSLIAN